MPAKPAWPPKSLPRLFVGGPLGPGIAVELDAGQANYLGNVMRLKLGDEALLFDGASGEWLGRVAEAGKKRMTLSIERRTGEQEAVPDCWLAFAPVKRSQTDWLGGKATQLGIAPFLPVTTPRTIVQRSQTDWLVEKATELGIARLLPVTTRRTIVERVKLERLEAIAVEAAEQCNRTTVPEIAEPIALETFLKGRDHARTLYFADETGGEPAGAAFKPGAAVIVTGPEGGFTGSEREAIRAAPNAIAISLGPRI